MEVVMRDATIAAGALLLGLGVGVALTLWLTGRRGDGIARVSDTVHRLERLLRASNPRGRYGEQLLEDLLARTLPPDGWEPKHRFRAGQVVDAVVRLPGGLVPIDVKFPDSEFDALCEAPSEAESRRRRRAFADAMIRHVEETRKYIRPDEKTLDFALCFVPNEGALYELLRPDPADAGRPDMFAYALERRVFLVSPSTLFAYLTTIGLGLRGVRIHANARRILDAAGELEQTLRALQEGHATFTKHLRDAWNRSGELGLQLAELPAELARLIDAVDEAVAVEDRGPKAELARGPVSPPPQPLGSGSGTPGA
jgi:DNA recombination protein RmuC